MLLPLACTKVVEFELPPAPQQNALNVILTADSFIGGFAYQTLSPTGSDSVKFITEGSMVIKDEDGNTQAFQLNNPKGSYFSSNRVKQGECYSMNFTSSLGVSSSNACIPAHPKVIIIDSGLRVRQAGSADTLFFINIGIEDSANISNFYRITCEADVVDKININPFGQNDTTYRKVNLPINSNNLLYFVNEYNFDNRALLLKDDNFDGQIAYLNFTVSTSRSKSLQFYVDAIDENLFNYHSTAAAQFAVQTDPNAHYINVYNNINNGFGIMGGRNRVLIKWLRHW